MEELVVVAGILVVVLFAAAITANLVVAVLEVTLAQLKERCS